MHDTLTDMPSLKHEALVDLFRESPRFGLRLTCGVVDVDILPGAPVTLTSAEFTELNPPEYRADVVLRVDDPEGEAHDVFIVEIQLAPDPDKKFSWPFYAAGARARFRCPATIVVVAMSEQVAEWCAQPIPMDRAGSSFRLVVIGPAEIPVITDIDRARAEPELAILSAVAHGREPGAEFIGVAALAACDCLDNQRGRLYADLVFDSLSPAACQALGHLMDISKYEYQSDFARKYVAEGRRQGQLEGQRELLREQLEVRFGVLPEDVRGRLESGTSEQFACWARRILTAGTLQEVFADEPQAG